MRYRLADKKIRVFVVKGADLKVVGKIDQYSSIMYHGNKYSIRKVADHPQFRLYSADGAEDFDALVKMLKDRYKHSTKTPTVKVRRSRVTAGFVIPRRAIVIKSWDEERKKWLPKYIYAARSSKYGEGYSIYQRSTGGGDVE